MFKSHKPGDSVNWNIR